MSEHTKPTQETKDADRAAASADHTAGRPASAEEAAAADGSRDLLTDEARAANKAATERGAAVKGEGRVG